MRSGKEDPVAPKLKFGDVTPTQTAERELRWFFNEADVECDQPSNYAALVVAGVRHADLTEIENRAEANHAAGKIKAWLRKVSETDALMLQGLYRERLWPRVVQRALGPLAGAVVALPTVCVLHARAFMNCRTELGDAADWIEEIARTRPEALVPWRAEAERNCAIAIRAYERERGDGECVAPDGEED